MFFLGSKSKLGIDIGTSSIKVAQLKKENHQFFLETYGVVNVTYETQRMGMDAITQTAEIIKELLRRCRVSTRQVVASLPNNIVFVSVIDMPALSDKELKSAIEWEARRYVPLPLEEVTLSWSVLRDRASAEKLKVLLTAVPTTVIDNYLKMFKLANLQPQALEIESVALIRSLVGERKDSFLIIDIGARNTSLSLVDKGFLRLSRNLAIGGDTITSGIAGSLKVSLSRAEQFKRDLGITGELGQIPQALRPTVDTIKDETAQLLKIYESNGGEIQEIIFCGSGSKLPGLLQYFSQFGAKVSLGDPLKFINYPEQLRENLLQVSTGLAVSMGLAMRE